MCLQTLSLSWLRGWVWSGCARLCVSVTGLKVPIIVNAWMEPNASVIPFQTKTTSPPAIGEPVLRRSSLLSFLSISSVLILDHY